MSTVAENSIGWIVGTLSERDEILALLQDDGVHEPRDELGMASLRDVMSEAFFPGVTTLQTRAKYFLFIPAMYERIESEPSLRRRPERSIRMLEEELLEGLLARHAHDGQRGIIGERFRRPPANPASGIYWRGLSTWGIRRFHNTRAQYHAWLRQPARSLRLREVEEGVEEAPARWRIRDFKDDVLQAPTLDLLPEHASFLRDCLLGLPRQPVRSLISELVHEDVGSCHALWDTQAVMTGTAQLAELARHAERVAAAVHGAMLFYNLQCAHRFAPSAVNSWEARVEAWRAQHPPGFWISWDLDDLWRRLEPLPYGVNARRRTSRFLHDWLDVLRHDRAALNGSKHATNLVMRREQVTKPGRERLSGHCSQQNWTATGVGADPLDFRWRRAKQILLDVNSA